MTMRMAVDNVYDRGTCCWYDDSTMNKHAPAVNGGRRLSRAPCCSRRWTHHRAPLFLTRQRCCPRPLRASVSPYGKRPNRFCLRPATDATTTENPFSRAPAVLSNFFHSFHVPAQPHGYHAPLSTDRALYYSSHQTSSKHQRKVLELEEEGMPRRTKLPYLFLTFFCAPLIFYYTETQMNVNLCLYR